MASEPTTDTKSNEKPIVTKNSDSWLKQHKVAVIVGGGAFVLLLILLLMHHNKAASSSTTSGNTLYPNPAVTPFGAMNPYGSSAFGIPGPAGPTGPQGPPGPIGPPGQSNTIVSRPPGGMAPWVGHIPFTSSVTVTPHPIGGVYPHFPEQSMRRPLSSH